MTTIKIAPVAIETAMVLREIHNDGFFFKICENPGLTAKFAGKLYPIIQNDTKPLSMI